MKNESHPLMQALKARSKSDSPTFDLPEPARTFELKHEEIPGLPGKKVGEAISVHLHGHVHLQHNDGHAVMHVSSVKPDSEEMDTKSNPDTEIRVKTQQSHV